MPIKTASAKPPEPTEADIQKAIVSYLVSHGWVTVRVNSSSFKNKQQNTYVRGYTIGGLGASSGYPDVVAYKGHVFVLLEVKRADGVLSESQKRFHDYAAARGVPVHVVRSLEQLEAILAALPEGAKD